jgi:hypothetical protein
MFTLLCLQPTIQNIPTYLVRVRLRDVPLPRPGVAPALVLPSRSHVLWPSYIHLCVRHRAHGNHRKGNLFNVSLVTRKISKKTRS